MVGSAAVTLLLATAGASSFEDGLTRFGLTGLFVLWVALLSAGIMCWLLRWINQARALPFIAVFGLVVSQAVLFLALLVALMLDRHGLLPLPLDVEPVVFIVRNLVIGMVVFCLFTVFWSVQNFWIGQISADSESRLQALQSRIRPHFLFNTLNTISSLIHDHPDQAEQATMDLSDLLRTGLKDQSTHALSDELELIRGYLRIEQLRLGERLNVEWDIADAVPLDQQLPPLLLQPLVENAVLHGISRRAEGGTLRIEGQRIRFGRIHFTVTNPLADPDSRPAEGNQSALENIRQRLALAYEERYGLTTWIEDGHFIAELTIPVT